jgi:hypothetical protein
MTDLTFTYDLVVRFVIAGMAGYGLIMLLATKYFQKKRARTTKVST